METVSNVLGFFASLVLFYPGWRGSKLLRTLDQVRASARAAKERGDPFHPGAVLAERLQEQSASWSSLDHTLLMLGFALLCLSFFCGLL